MVSFSWSWKSVALRWHFFFLLSSVVTFQEYFALYSRQLGFTAKQIGFTSFFGVPVLFLPLIGVLADRYRVRKLVLFSSIFSLIFLSLAPLTLLPKIIYPCDTTKGSYHLNNETKDFLNATWWVTNISDLSPKTTSKNTSNLIFSQSEGYSVLPATDNQSFLGNRTWNSLKRNSYVSSYSVIFLLMVLIRVLYIILFKSAKILCNVAVMTYIKKDKAKYGTYFACGLIGVSISLFLVATIASYATYTVCGRVVYGYFVAFIFVAITTSLSLIAIPWIKFEYLEHRVINWAEVKSIIFSSHYMFLLFMDFYIGWRYAFQYYWEYWYIAELAGTPTVMAIGGLIRRPLAILWFLLSEKLINRLGELRTVAIAPFLFAVSEMALSYIQIPWLVLVVDFFQSAAWTFGYSAITVHFSKAGSKASSGFILGLAELAFGFGEAAGSTAMGIFFSSFGVRHTLFYYSITSTVILVLFIAYLITGKNLDDYERLEDTDSESE